MISPFRHFSPAISQTPREQKPSPSRHRADQGRPEERRQAAPSPLPAQRRRTAAFLHGTDPFLAWAAALDKRFPAIGAKKSEFLRHGRTLAEAVEKFKAGQRLSHEELESVYASFSALKEQCRAMSGDRDLNSNTALDACLANAQQELDKAWAAIQLGKALNRCAKL